MPKLKDNIFYVGANDWDRKIFDELVPLKEGTSYNSYLIVGSEKTALIDSVDPDKSDVLFSHLDRIGLEKLDYIVSNHCEQDHSGAIPAVLAKYHGSKVVTNKKNFVMLQEHLHIKPEDIIVIEDRETLSLGDKTLQFFMLPWVHWPETMGTYAVEDKILFPCDMFGSHYATSETFAMSNMMQMRRIKSYYAEIMMPFRKIIKRDMDIVRSLELDMIAPSHGPVLRDPQFAIDIYDDCVSDRVANHVVIPYVSMHHSTKLMVQHLTDALVERGIKVTPYNLTGCEMGELLSDIVDCATIVFAGSQVLAGAHPALAYITVLVNALKPKARHIGLIGSYGWGGRMVEQVKAMLSGSSSEIMEPVMVKGMPRAEDLAALEQFAQDIYERHQAIVEA
jgi:flavorubredoxin